MVKMIKRIALGVVIFLSVIMIKSYANELALECPNSVDLQTQTTVKYTLKGNFTENVNSVKVRFFISDGVRLQSYTPSEGWSLVEGGTAGDTGLIIRNETTDVTGNVVLGEFLLNVPSTYNKKTISLKIYDLDATNFHCDIVEFSPEYVIEKVANPLGTEDEPPIDEENNEGSNSGNGENTNGGDESNINPNEANGNNNEDRTQEMSSTPRENANQSTESNSNKSSRKKDHTASDSPFGQFGEKSCILVIIALVVISFILYRKFQKFRKLE